MSLPWTLEYYIPLRSIFRDINKIIQMCIILGRVSYIYVLKQRVSDTFLFEFLVQCSQTQNKFVNYVSVYGYIFNIIIKN